MKSFHLIVICFAGTSSSLFAHENSLCLPTEEVFFACQIAKSAKLNSICGNTKAREKYVQYRFGRPGKVELSYPAFKTDSLQRFNYSFGSIGADRGIFHVSFKISSYKYSVFSENIRGLGVIAEDLGVRISDKSEKEAELKCVQTPAPIDRLEELVDEIELDWKDRLEEDSKSR